MIERLQTDNRKTQDGIIERLKQMPNWEDATAALQAFFAQVIRQSRPDKTVKAR